MIVFIVILGVALLLGVFVILPPLPPTPQVLLDLSTSLADILFNTMYFMSHVLTKPLLLAILGVSMGLFLFQPVYHSVMWVLKKIPVLGIK